MHSDGRNRRVRLIPQVSDGIPAARHRLIVETETPMSSASSPAVM
jgi:hypothetical protein